MKVAPLKVGTLCYCTEQGLGFLARDFYVHGVVTDPFIVTHTCRPSLYQWYPPSTPRVDIRKIAGNRDIMNHCKRMDMMLFFETPFDWQLIEWCRNIGVKTVIMPMHECMPAKLPAVPDLMLCPSALDYHCYKYGPCPALFLPVPASDKVTWRERTRAYEWVHNAGHGGLRGRNGTKEVVEAWWYVKSPALLHVRSQSNYDEDIGRYTSIDRRITYEVGTIPEDRLYSTGDVFIFPEKFNGLSLPLQEAHAAGMLVMATDRFPNTQWLPMDPLIPVLGTHKARIGPPYREYDEAVIDPVMIAKCVDNWYGKEISHYSLLGKEWSKCCSWSVLHRQYIDVLEELVGGAKCV